MVDSRATLRYPIDLPARIKIAGSELACRIGNLSVGGVFLIGPQIPAGTRVLVKFSAPHLKLFESACIAQWSGEDGTGLAFEGLSAVDTYALAKFIRHASRITQRLPTEAILRPPAG